MSKPDLVERASQWSTILSVLGGVGSLFVPAADHPWILCAVFTIGALILASMWHAKARERWRKVEHNFKVPFLGIEIKTRSEK